MERNAFYGLPAVTSVRDCRYCGGNIAISDAGVYYVYWEETQ